MGWLSKLKKALGVAEALAPALPIPDKAKRIVSKVGETERDVEDLVREVKPAKPPKPAA